MRNSLLLAALLGPTLLACAHTPAPCPATPASTVAVPGTTPSAPTDSVSDARASASLDPNAVPSSAEASAKPALVILLRPIARPTPLVHVEIEANVPGAPLATWHLAAGTAARVTHATARDAKHALPVQVKAAGLGLDLVLDGASSGPIHLEYDVASGDDAPDDPFGLLVLDDRFRGGGERLLAIPESIQDTALPLVVRIDGEPLRADRGASSLGVGFVHRARVRPRALRYATFLAGSLGMQVIQAVEGNDEGAWLGYTSFDPRPAVAELAQIRTGLAEFLKSRQALPGPTWTYLFVSQSRPIGSFTTTPRFESVLLQVGPSEPWGAPLRLSMTQQLTRRFIGDAIRFTPTPGHERELGWFNDGVARYVAMRLLSRLGLLAPNDWQQTISGELSVLATSPYAALGNADLEAQASKDPVARATLMARGAIYAARESATIAARSKGEHALDTVLIALLARATTDEGDSTRALPASAWLDALGKEDPDAAKTFDAIIAKGGPATLPPTALGPCFRAGSGEYVAFDPGFDLEATRIEKDGKVVGVRADGPAAKAGLKDGDILESMQAREGDATVPVKLAVTRGGQKLNFTYAPRGAHGRGQTWTRVKGIPDDKCGEAP